LVQEYMEEEIAKEETGGSSFEKKSTKTLL
jgi:hypothetical protein